MTTFIIEHCEPKVFLWCILEYTQMKKYVGKKNLFFTNVKKQEGKKLTSLGKVETKSVTKLNLENVCVLDPNAEQTLTPKDKFEYVVFGGILGDAPARGRTKVVLTDKMKNVQTRNLTPFQMSTDTAVLVTKLILDGTPIEKIPFQDTIEVVLKTRKFQESVILPYRYVLKNGKPLFNKKLVKYLAEKQSL